MASTFTSTSQPSRTDFSVRYQNFPEQSHNGLLNTGSPVVFVGIAVAFGLTLAIAATRSNS